MSRLSQLAIAKRSVTLLLAAATFIGGVLAWGSLKQELLPDVAFPIVTVIAPYPGAGAADVAEQVTKPLERAISSVPDLDQLQSTSANSIAFLVAQFAYGADLDEALATVEENVRRARLPSGVEATVSPFDFTSAPVVLASVSGMGDTGLEEAGRIVREELAPELLSLAGVASVEVTGGLESRVVITLDPARLAAAGVAPPQVVGVLQASNLTIPGGEVSIDGTRVPVSTIGRFESIDELAKLVVGVRMVEMPAPVASPPSSPTAAAAPATVQVPVPVTVGDIGKIERLDQPTTGYARTNGQPSVNIAVSKTGPANTVTVARAVQDRIAAVAARHPGAIQAVTVSDTSTFIVESSNGLVVEGGLGAIFAVLTIFLFLFSVRSTFVAAVSIPLSILAALLAMQVFGITLNILTLGGLAVAVGRVVDDSIVVLENIYRHRALGDDRLTASTQGPREVAGAITASTLTTVAVFLPLGFAGGFVSQLFLSFSLTVTFALLASLAVSLTVVPVLAYLLMGRVRVAVDETGEPRNSIWVRLYDPTIRAVLQSRWTRLGVVGLAAVLFAGSLALAPLLPTQFINSGSEKVMTLRIAPPSGAGSDQVLARATEAETILRADPDVRLVAISVPTETDAGFQSILAASFGQAPNSALVLVRLDPHADLDAAIRRTADALAPLRTGGYDVTVGQQTGAGTNSLNVVISADDPALVARATEAVLAALRGNPDLGNLASDLVKASAEIQVRVDPARALAVGTTPAQVGTQIRGILTPQSLGRIQLGTTDPVELVLRLDASQLGSIEALRALPVSAQSKATLGSIASVEQAVVQGRISRLDESPSATITAEIRSGDTGTTSREVQAAVDRLQADGTIPPGVAIRLAGVTQQQSEAFQGLFVAMGVAILLVYLMMVLAFNSLITPFIILFALPLATIGAFPALLLTGRPIGISALIGFLMLIGIVVTNAIVLLDLVERLRADGHTTRAALIEGGRTRVRPILMTAIATILALVPLAAGLNEGSIIAAELGTVVIGGLLSSTFLTLLVVPAVYALIDSVKERRRPPPSASSTTAAEPGASAA
jgi:HAE1 family hydrophobic/amphiphilic exporter-1